MIVCVVSSPLPKCALPALRASGVCIYKIVGRGAPLSRKLQLAGRLQRLLEEMPASLDEKWFQVCRDSYRDLFGHPCSEHNCYYPEVLSGEPGPGS